MSVTAKGRVTPKDLAGPKPMFEVHKRVTGNWRWFRTVQRPLSVTGTYRAGRGRTDTSACTRSSPWSAARQPTTASGRATGSSGWS